MGAHGSKEKLSRTYSERIINTHSQVIERERFGSFGKRASKGKNIFYLKFTIFFKKVFTISFYEIKS